MITLLLVGCPTEETDRTPSFAMPTIAPLDATVGMAFSETLPLAGGGAGTFAYSLGPTAAIPAGLTFNPASRTIDGTPTEPTATAGAMLIYTATDVDGGEVSLPVTIIVEDAPTFAVTTVNLPDAIVNSPFSQDLPPASGGNGTLLYTLVPVDNSAANAIPAGLTFTPASRTIGGTPTEPTAGAMLIYTATDANGDVISLPVTIIVEDAPTFGTQTIADMVFVLGATAAPDLPEATGGDQPLVYSLTMAAGGGIPPTWIGFNGDSRTLTITTTAIGTANLTYRVTDADGHSDSLDFMVAVEVDVDPTFAGMAIAPQTYPTGQTVPQWTLPAATDGNGTLEYTLVPVDSSAANAIPVGIAFNPDNRTIGGIPTTAAAEATLTYAVRDTNGDTEELALTITIIATADGSAANPYLVSDAEELRSIALGFRSADPDNGAFDYGTGDAAQTTEFGLSLAQSLAAHYRQTADIILCAAPTDTANCTAFVPIGNDYPNTSGTPDTPFGGSYDGDGNAISGLRVDSGAGEAPALYSWGLFGYVNGSTAEIRDVTLQSPAVTGTIIAGTLVGRLGEGAMVTDSAVDGGTVTATATLASIGGLVGVSSGTIANGAASATVNSSVFSIGDHNVGGLVGQLAGSAAVIKDSHATGVVNGGASGDVIGGLVGFMTNTSLGIENSYATGTVNGGAGGNDTVGGLVGRSITGTIRNSYATGIVNGGTGDADRVGGLVGHIGAFGTLENSYATGAVNGGAGDTDIVGGLVGQVDFGTLENSYATGDVDGGAGNDAIGGLVGTGQTSSTITNAYHSGANADPDTDPTVGDLFNDLGEARTPAQLQCPMAPTADCDGAGGTLAGGATTYDGWSADNWNFGDASTLPKVLVKGTATDEVGGQ